MTLQFRDANLRMVFESLSKTSGINILLDKDVRADLKTSIFVKDVSVEDTIDLILMQNQLEKKVLSDNTIFVYPNLPAKNKEYQDLKVQELPSGPRGREADADADQDDAEDQGHRHQRKDQLAGHARHAGRDPAGRKDRSPTRTSPIPRSCWKSKCWKSRTRCSPTSASAIRTQ